MDFLWFDEQENEEKTNVRNQTKKKKSIKRQK